MVPVPWDHLQQTHPCEVWPGETIFNGMSDADQGQFGLSQTHIVSLSCVAETTVSKALTTGPFTVLR